MALITSDCAPSRPLARRAAGVRKKVLLSEADVTCVFLGIQVSHGLQLQSLLTVPTAAAS